MPVTLNDIAEGNGPEYILLAKWHGNYTIFCSGEKLQDIIDHVENIREKVKKRKNGLSTVQKTD